MTPGFTVIDDFEGLQRLRGEWDELLAADACRNPFLSFTWTRSWLRSFAASYDRFLVARVEEPGQFRGIVPLIVRRSWSGGIPVRSLEFPGGDDSVFKGPVAEGDAAKLVDRLMRGLMSDVRGWDTLAFDSLPDDSPWVAPFAHAFQQHSLHCDRHPTHQSPYLRLPGNYDDLRKSLKKSLRQNLSRKLNMAEREGVVFERLTGAAVRAEHFREAQDVERRSWKGRRGIGIFVDEPHLSLHAGLLDDRPPFDVDLLFLRIGGKAIAFQYGFLLGNRYYAYNTSYDEAFQRLSPGMLAINSLLLELIPRRIEVFDFLVGDDSYKRDWTSDARGLEGFTVFQNSLAGQLACRLERLRPPVRRIRNLIRGLVQPTPSKQAAS
jgi:CelD/BcsL family acetyltransferase involved in cellulose biosynthesis